MLGFPSAEALLSAPLAEIMSRWVLLTPEGTPQPLAELPGRRALMGEEPEDVLVQFIDRETDETRWSRIKAKPVRDADGSVRLAINVIEDVTELKQVEQSQRFLAEASRALADSLEYESTLASIAQLAVPVVADWCAVDLVADVAGELDRVAVAHVDPDEGDLGAGDRRALPGRPARRPRRAPRPAHRRVAGVARHPGRADRRGRAGRGAPAPDPDARHDLGDDGPDARARSRLRRDLVRERGVGAALRRRRPAARGGSRAARGHRRRERPPLPRPHHDRPHAAGVAAAAGAARGPRHRGRRAVPARRRGARGRRRLLRPLRDDRGPLVRGHRRRLRQGRRGRGRHGPGALHDPGRGGPAPLTRRDPQLGQRGDAARGLLALLHDRRRAPRPLRAPRRG